MFIVETAGVEKSGLLLGVSVLFSVETASSGMLAEMFIDETAGLE